MKVMYVANQYSHGNMTTSGNFVSVCVCVQHLTFNKRDVSPGSAFPTSPSYIDTLHSSL